MSLGQGGVKKQERASLDGHRRDWGREGITEEGGTAIGDILRLTRRKTLL